MFRAPQTWMLASGLLLAGALPASAQYRFSSAILSRPSSGIFLEQTRPAAQLAAPVHSEPLFATPAPAVEPKPGTTLESSFRYEETPFSQRVQLPVARLLSGRIQLRGFDTVESSESADWPGWSVTTQAHPGVWVPRASERFGVSLDIRLKRDAGEGRPIQFLRCLGWLVGAGRGCRLL